MRGLILLLAMFLGAGLVLSGCGDDDTATTPAPAPPPPPPPAPEPEPEPEPAAPEAPATPTGLHVDETTETSIEWHWNAVEGAIGYAVQVSMDEMFDATDKIVPTVENHYTESDLEPETSVYLRVAAAAGTLEEPILSDWSTHVTGMSAMPPPPPPPAAPDPVMATFSIPEDADSPYYLVPVDGPDDTNKDKATASVNSEIMVESNTSAVITPMFVDGANGVSVSAGDGNMPFAFVDWTALQKDVVSEAGVVFMIQRTTMGANQEMEPTGDVAYVTCGPFQCTESMDMMAMAPAISIDDSATCSGWEEDFKLEVGRVDNTANSADPFYTGARNTTASAAGETTRSANPNTGVDLGWSYTSTAGFTAEHSLAIVSAKSGAVMKSSTRKNLVVPDVTGIHGSAVADAPDTTDTETVIDPCDYYDGQAGNVAKPGGSSCFRILANPDANYYDNYEVTLTASDSSVGWGKISWDAFKGLKCDSRSFKAADEVDVCDLFAAELDLLGKVTAQAEVVTTHAALSAAATVGSEAPALIQGFDFDIKRASKGERFNSLWYKQSTRSGSSNDAHNSNTTDLYVDADSTADGNQTTVSKTAANWFVTLDEDNDPKGALGDLGLVDSNGDDRPDNFAGAQGSSPDVKCSRDDGGEKRTALDKKGTDATTDDEGNGSLCDAEDVEFETSVTFVDGIGLGCSETLTFTVTCQWDADGGEAAAVTTNADGDDVVSRTTAAATFGPGATAGYLSCKATSAR
jgi:hypothetical protein